MKEVIFFDYQSKFSTKLRDLIEEKGITKQKLSEEIGVSRQAISQYCDGSTVPNADKFLKIAEFFDVSLDYLVGKTESRTPVDSVEGELVRVICDYTGLEEDTVDFLAESKVDCLSDIYNDFLNFFIANTNEELTLSLINLRELSTVHNLLLSEFHYMVAEKFNSVTLGEALKEVESNPDFSELFGKVVHLDKKIEDLQVNIDGQKFKISKIFNNLIDEFALSNIESSSECDIHTSNTSLIYAIEDIHKSFLELKKYAMKSSAAEGAEDNGNHKKEK